MTDMLTPPDTAALKRTVARLENELAAEQRHNTELRQLASQQADRLQQAQAENESAYRSLYDAASGPHFCKDHPFGELTARPRPGIRDLAKGES
ncbi:hypothetical protein [Streptomyces luteocolor]|uniref:hypothetical protein n=1 Tax=Streptomyces luteocolor TaxID=285500 RepID=UPI0008530B87|nr:hypothetical protein [Streptomyces luteocolor]